jgi:hypothetical protein
LYVLLIHRPTWEARQSLSLREEAASGLSHAGRPGRFDGLDSMKIAQETVLELAQSRSVVAAALAEVGPPANGDSQLAWPTQRDIEKLQGELQIKAPRGAEFGKTEVFYLLVRDHDRQRAILLSQALARQLELRLQAVRDQKANSLVDELTRSVGVARSDLDAATERLARLEHSVGGDLAELRLLTDSIGGESNLRMALTAVKNDVRAARVSQTDCRQLLELLRQAQKDPTQLLATPNELLTLQPSLQRLKEGMIEAQLSTARLKGTMTAEHPLVRAATLAETEIRERIHGEITLAIHSLEAELGLGQARLATLNEHWAETSGRMERLAGLRAHYANAVSQVQHFDEMLKNAQHELASARATAAAAHASSLLTRLEEPYTPNDPCGPRRAVIVLAGILGGLAAGWGWVFLLTSPALAPSSASAPVENVEAPSKAPAATLPTSGFRPPSLRNGFGRRASNDFAAPSRHTEPVRALSLKQALARLA